MTRHTLLVIDDGVTPAEQDVAGRYWASVAAEMVEAGEVLEVATLRPGGAIHRRLATDGIASWDLGGSPGGRIPLRALAPSVPSVRPTLIHAHEVVPALAAARIGRKVGSPVLFHRHHSVTRGPHRLLSRLAARSSDLTVCVSNDVARAAGELDGTPSHRIRIAHNGVIPLRSVDQHELEEARLLWGIESDLPVITVVSRLRAEKGIDTFLEAAEIMSARGRRARFLVVGSGPEESALRRVAAGGRAGVILTGHFSDVALPVALADVVCQPSRNEPFGLSVVEAMSAGKPVVASAVGGLLEVVSQGVTGLLVEPGDAHALAEALSDLVDDVPRRERMARAAKESFGARFTMTTMIERWRAIYDEVAA